jgi:hypothetical protein
MMERKKSQSAYSNKETIYERSIHFSELENENNMPNKKTRRSILKHIMNNYENKYNNNSRRQSKSRKSVNFKDKDNESILYDLKESPDKKLTRSDFKSNSSTTKNMIELDLDADNKIKKDNSFNRLILQITHNTQNNISIINSGRNSPRSIIEKASFDFPQFSILKRGSKNSPQNKKVGFNDDLTIESLKKGIKKMITTKEISKMDLNDPNYIEDSNNTVESFNINDSITKIKRTKTQEMMSNILKESLEGILEETERSLEGLRKEKYKEVINDPKFPKVVCENIGYLSGVAAITFKGQR